MHPLRLIRCVICYMQKIDSMGDIESGRAAPNDGGAGSGPNAAPMITAEELGSLVLASTPRSAQAVRAAYAKAVKTAHASRPAITKLPWFQATVTFLLIIFSVAHTLYLKMILHELPSHAFFVNQWSTIMYAILISITAYVRYWLDPKVYTSEVSRYQIRW